MRKASLSALGLCGVFAVLLGVNAACNTGPKGPVSVPLQFRPEHAEPLSGSLPTTDVKVHLEAVKDKRKDQDQIGVNVEDEVPLPVYSSGKSPAEFFREVLENEMSNFGVEMVDAPEAADRIIAVDLNRFWCEEGNNYKGEVSATATVTDKGGQVLWRGPIAGQGTDFGRSRSPANYNSVFSDATRRAVGALILNPKFADALTR